MGYSVQQQHACFETRGYSQSQQPHADAPEDTGKNKQTINTGGQSQSTSVLVSAVRDAGPVVRFSVFVGRTPYKDHLGINDMSS